MTERRRIDLIIATLLRIGNRHWFAGAFPSVNDNGVC